MVSAKRRLRAVLGGQLGESQLPSRDAARAACVSTQWRDLILHDEHLWKRFVADDLGLSEKRGADGTNKLTYRHAYASWRLSYGAEYWPYLPRAIRAWERIKGWLAANYPAVHATIQGGASEADLAEAEAALGFRLPPAVKVLYRLHNGQALALDTALDRHEAARAAAKARFDAAKAQVDELLARQQQQAKAGGADADAAAAAATAVAAATAELAAAQQAQQAVAGPTGPETEAELGSIFHGLFGGYSVYDHMVCTRMMPLQRAVQWTRAMELHRIRPRINPAGGMFFQPNLLAVACSFRVYDKLFVADVSTGGMWVVRRGMRGTMLEPASPGETSAGRRDGLLDWFEEYANRLVSGNYQVAPLDDELAEGSRAISLFPLRPPGMAEAVTRGVRVRASVAYVPEQLPGNKHVFAYSIRMALLEPAQLGAGLGGGPPLLRCQLLSRHWVIRDENGQVVDQVRGDGVIGMYPILEPGRDEFVYCSCTHQVATRGSMEGEFRFVEGTSDRPTGPVFDVVCPPFQLDVPSYVY
ncbi:hypothetical protein GPECTOR_46g292 [Gonium pectorale]|uniref:ApaG domain-containing protein n=1 Tax=Gonium pectorale TaxID=33097 RepID=A0A150G8X8_GONPE|nr:hypothetical protein GPECTOR_46g292 [Gonium pectorale]|eukprot:KXZ46223.1 hypothetical protein GPECTOR_46g292 [Gonium pectorale]